MMAKERRKMEKGDRKHLGTIFGDGAVLEGTLTVPHGVRIEGTLKGKLESTETVTIGASGIVEADIRARTALVAGKVVGNLIADERVELESTASLTGDLRCRTLVINEGATFKGKSSMDEEESDTVV